MLRHLKECSRNRSGLTLSKTHAVGRKPISHMLDCRAWPDSCTDFPGCTRCEQLLVVDSPMLMPPTRATPIDLPSREREMELQPTEYIWRACFPQGSQRRHGKYLFFPIVTSQIIPLSTASVQTLKLRHGRLSGIELEVRTLLLACPYVDMSPTSIIEFDPEPRFAVSRLHADGLTFDRTELAQRHFFSFESARSEPIQSLVPRLVEVIGDGLAAIIVNQYRRSPRQHIVRECSMIGGSDDQGDAI